MGQLNLYWHTFEETGSIHSYMSYSKWKEMTERALEQPPSAGRPEEKEILNDHTV